MNQPAQLAPAARREAAHAVRWLAKRNPAASRGLRQAILEAARLIGVRPLAGRRRPELVGERYRFWALTRFPYLLVYDPLSDPVQILRLVHMRQDLPRALADLGKPTSDRDG